MYADNIKVVFIPVDWREGVWKRILMNIMVTKIFLSYVYILYYIQTLYILVHTSILLLSEELPLIPSKRSNY